jgi:hypothetical protein
MNLKRCTDVVYLFITTSGFTKQEGSLLSRAEVAPEQQVSSPRKCGEENSRAESPVGLDQFRSYKSWRDVVNSADIILHSTAARSKATWRVGSGQEGGYAFMPG